MIVFHPDLYDALELSVLSTRGIGAWEYAEEGMGGYEPTAIPICLRGHTAAIDGQFNGPADELLTEAIPDGAIWVSDCSVIAINQRGGKKNLNSRVSWAEFVAEAQIVRGDHVSK